MATTTGVPSSTPTRAASGNPQSIRLNLDQSLVVATRETRYGELAKETKIFQGVIGNGATFKAPVTAVPTTTATWGLWNGEAAGGKIYYPIKIGFFLASGTAAVGATLIATASDAVHGSVPSAYAASVISNNGGGATTKARLINAATVPGTQPAWAALKSSQQAAATTIGIGEVADVEGLYAINPTYALYIDILSRTCTTHVA
jgi:hypothetical protein